MMQKHFSKVKEIYSLLLQYITDVKGANQYSLLLTNLL